MPLCPVIGDCQLNGAEVTVNIHHSPRYTGRSWVYRCTPRRPKNRVSRAGSSGDALRVPLWLQPRHSTATTSDNVSETDGDCPTAAVAVARCQRKFVDPSIARGRSSCGRTTLQWSGERPGRSSQAICESVPSVQQTGSSMTFVNPTEGFAGRAQRTNQNLCDIQVRAIRRMMTDPSRVALPQGRRTENRYRVAL